MSEYRIITPAEFPAEWFKSLGPQQRSRGNPRSRQRIKYWDILTAFDIETTRISEIEQSVMYVWQWAFGPELVVMGRTWDEFQEFVKLLRSLIPEGVMLAVWVHNLSFEFQFLRGILRFETDDVFCVKPRKVLRARWSGLLEFRCSYLHSNMSLGEFTRKMHVEHVKLSGKEYDYDKPRYPWTPMTARELEYCSNDVVGLVEALAVEMELDGDNLYTIPLTSTGYVRRDAKHAMRQVSHSYLTTQLPDVEIFAELREAFRGGDTHGNRFYTITEDGDGQTVRDVEHVDRSSSYPDVICNDQYPVSPFFQQEGRMDWEELSKLIFIREKAVVCRCAFTKLRLRDPFFPAPYLSRDKCRQIMGATFDNGRILEAEYLETTITDVDLRIIARDYRWESAAFWDVAYSRYGPLPDPLKKLTIEYYRMKTELKGAPGQDVYYTKAKNKLNSIYGMMAQNPAKGKVLFIQDGVLDKWGQLDYYPEDKSKTTAEILEDSKKRAFLCYQWGVWVTAWARYRLREAIWTVIDQGAEFLYCDTDSVFYQGSVDWREYNRQRTDASKASGAYATDAKGRTHYMGVLEPEDHVEEFRTMGAKKYVCRINGKLISTIAGVGKSAGGRELEAAGGIQAFAPGFMFREAGGVEAIYNDVPEVTSWEVEGRTLQITSNVTLRPSTYTLGLAADYERLLRNLRYTMDFYDTIDTQ